MVDRLFPHAVPELYRPPVTAAHLGTTALLISNELASPLRGPGGSEGNFAEYTRLIADELQVPVFRVVRPGSTHETHDPDMRAWLSPRRREGTIADHTKAVLWRLGRDFPEVERIVLAGHSAGSAHTLEMARAIGERDLLGQTGLGHVALDGVVVSDHPSHRSSHIGGIFRFALYRVYESLFWKDSIPPKSPLESDEVTPGVNRRFLNDALYNSRAWSQGMGQHLEYIAASMPRTAAHAFPARHSANNIMRWPGQLNRYARRVNNLRRDTPGAAPCVAEIVDAPHGAGSRPLVMAKMIRQTGLLDRIVQPA